MRNHTTTCEFCGTPMVFTTHIRKKDGTVVYPKGKFFVFCPAKHCPRK